MKKIFLFLLFICFLLPSKALTVTIDKLTYSIENGKATVTGPAKGVTTLHNLVIPDKIEYAGQQYPVTSIGYEAFKDCIRFTGNLVIPNSVTSISYAAFWECYGFTGDLIIPSSVTSIGSSAFWGCSGFTGDLVIPNSVTIIRDYAFYGCKGFNGKLIIPNSVTKIEKSAFSGCSGLTGELIIPNSVTSIGDSAFTICSGFTGELVIPNSVTSIGDDAFFCCSGFSGDLIIPNSITSIGNYTFTGCSGFSGDLIIPNSITSIGDRAFFDCLGFTGELVIPNSVTSIGTFAFFNCKFIKVTSSREIPPVAAANAFDSFCKTVPLFVPKNSMALYKVATGWKEFITINTIPVAATNIILNKSELTLIIGEEQTLMVTLIPYDADDKIVWTSEDQDKVVSVDQNGKITAINVGKTIVTATAGKVSASCDVVVNPVLASDVDLNLNDITLCVGKSYQLNAIVIPENVTDKTITWTSENEGIVSVESTGLITGVSVGKTYIVATCGEVSDKCIVNVRDIEKGDEFIFEEVTYVVTSMEEMTCKTKEETQPVTEEGYLITNLVIPEVATFLNYEFKVTEIAEKSFTNWGNLQSVTIPASISTIGDYAFHDCVNLRELNYYPNVDHFGLYVFPPTIEKLTLGSNLTYIPENFLVGGNKLKVLVIPNSVRNIGGGAFSDSKELRSLWIGTGITEINLHSFFYNGEADYEIPKIFWLPNNPPVNYEFLKGGINYISNDSYNFINTKKYQFLSSKFEKDGVIYVPISPSDRTADVIDCTYEESNRYINIGEKVTNSGIELSVINVNDLAFFNNKIIETVSLSNKENIGRLAFFDCNNITSLELNNTGEIGDFAFYDCNNFTDLYIPDGITAVGIATFMDCSSLNEIRLGSGFPALNKLVFAGCGSFNSISIPENVKLIDDYAFQGCTSLQLLTFEDSDSDIPLILGSNDTDPLFKDCPLDEVYIGCNIQYDPSPEHGYSPFSRNGTLRSVKITDRETEISEYEFFGCYGLNTIFIGNGVEKIRRWAFSGCSSLEYFSAGYRVAEIEDEAFSDCYNMKEYFSYSTNPPVCGDQALDDINKWQCNLIVPEGSENAYQTAPQWKEFFFITGIPIEVTDILFYDEDKEKELSVGDIHQLVPMILPENATNRNLVWESSNPSVVSVSEEGHLTGHSEGIATITVSHADNLQIYDSAFVTVVKTTSIGSLFEGEENTFIDAYDLSGRVIRHQATPESLNNLSPGIYIFRQGKVAKTVIIK